jgi:nitrate/nitrite-specific signal transduction histidine kinase
MKYKDKTKEQLINELAELHQRIEDLEAEATKRKKAEEALRKAYEKMDLRVKERTEDLVEANQQLFDLDKKDYLTFKTKEHMNQVILQRSIGTGLQ